MQNSVQQSGRHFLQVLGPTPVPERILAAMSRQMMDHRSPQFQDLAHRVLSGIRTIFRTKGPVFLFPSSGTEALEAALVNTLSSGDCVLFAGTGQFDLLWATTARDLGLRPIVIQTDWRSGADADQVEEHLRADIGHDIKAVCVVHNETSTGACAAAGDTTANNAAATSAAAARINLWNMAPSSGRTKRSKRTSWRFPAACFPRDGRHCDRTDAVPRAPTRASSDRRARGRCCQARARRASSCPAGT